MGQILQRVIVVWAIVDLLVWGLIFLAQKQVSFPQIGYYIVLLGAVGIPLWRNRVRLQATVQRWSLPPLARFLLLGYGMVLLEEIIAATFNHLIEGFDLPTFPLRIAQFWAFNIFAFTGLIFGWYILQRTGTYRLREAFFLVGLFGLYSEKTYILLITGPILFFLLAPLNILTYGLILSPALVSLPEQTSSTRSWIIRYPLALIIPGVLSIVPVGILIVLRSHFPDWFPPCRFIAC